MRRHVIGTVTSAQDYLPIRVKNALMILRRYPYWRNAGIIYIHIPKAAGFSISMALYGRPLGHLPAAEIRGIYPQLFDRLAVFSVTRNPWARLVSAYNFVVRGGTRDAGVRQRKDYSGPQFRSFPAFVDEWLTGRDLRRLDYVFQPQWRFLTDSRGRVLVDFIGKVEDLAEVEAFLSKEAGRRVAIEAHNMLGAGRRYREFYKEPWLIDRVGELYKADVQMFRYEF